MKAEVFFKETVSIRIWSQYFQRVARLTRSLSPEQQQDLRMELEDHLLQGYREEKGDSEAENLLIAIERIGDPEEYIKPMIAERLLERASRTFRPGAVVRGLFYYISGGVKKTLTALGLFLAYLCILLGAVWTLFKPIFPGHVGVFRHESGGLTIGVSGDFSGPHTDVLGYWVIPIGLATVTILYLLLTRRLKHLKPGKKQ